jgi:hypothetical protein
MTVKRKKLDMSLLLQVFWNDDVSILEHAVFSGCSSLTALTCSNLIDIQKFITLRSFIISVTVNNRWKSVKLLYIFYVYAQT